MIYELWPINFIIYLYYLFYYYYVWLRLEWLIYSAKCQYGCPITSGATFLNNNSNKKNEYVDFSCGAHKTLINMIRIKKILYVL